mmetsp:Transcript_71441/g.158871  ORF Transcript_71441/g.158871 Transcript_71441/m.158871 type:complete len:109 (+) Transcript_71441:65-391(+)
MCGVDKLPTHPREEQTDEHAFRITYQYYDKVTVETSYEDDSGKRKTTERLQLVKKTAPIGEFMAFYRKQLKYFTFHCLGWTTRRSRRSWRSRSPCRPRNKARRSQEPT